MSGINRAGAARRLGVLVGAVLSAGLLSAAPAGANPPPMPPTDWFVEQTGAPALLNETDGTGTLNLDFGVKQMNPYTGVPTFDVQINAPRGVDFTSITQPQVGTASSCQFTKTSATCHIVTIGDTKSVQVGLRYNGDNPDYTPETLPGGILLPGGKAVITTNDYSPGNNQVDLRIGLLCTS
ncbi:hypothetical protein [Streptomyces melanogenes]|uniref:hypothetical protein n=1 Tax=Streptomyces melanogenes TaxID=67326 RepID=UPI00167DA6D1|nr:hypothetical protein [Streptomyces melanogenes]